MLKLCASFINSLRLHWQYDKYEYRIVLRRLRKKESKSEKLLENKITCRFPYSYPVLPSEEVLTPIINISMNSERWLKNTINANKRMRKTIYEARVIWRILFRESKIQYHKQNLTLYNINYDVKLMDLSLYLYFWCMWDLEIFMIQFLI